MVYLPDLWVRTRRTPSSSGAPRRASTRSRYWPPMSSERSRLKTRRAAARRSSGRPASDRATSAQVKARSPMSMAAPAPKAAGSRAGDPDVRGRAPPPHLGAVHDVVVDEGADVQQLDRAGGPDGG